MIINFKWSFPLHKMITELDAIIWELEESIFDFFGAVFLE